MIFFRETEFVNLFLSSVNVNNKFETRRFVVSKFVKLCDELVTDVMKCLQQKSVKDLMNSFQLRDECNCKYLIYS